MEIAEFRTGLIDQARLYAVKIPPEPETSHEADIFALQSLLTFGIKGVAAYTYHAHRFGKTDNNVFKFIEEALVAPLKKILE